MVRESEPVIRPWKPDSSATIATRPRSRPSSSFAIDADGSSVTGEPLVADVTGSWKRAASTPTRSSRSDSSITPTRRPSSTTGSCETSAGFMRWNAESNESSGDPREVDAGLPSRAGRPAHETGAASLAPSTEPACVTLAPGGTSSVTHTLPPITAPRPMVTRPRIVAPA